MKGTQDLYALISITVSVRAERQHNKKGAGEE